MVNIRRILLLNIFLISLLVLITNTSIASVPDGNFENGSLNKGWVKVDGNGVYEWQIVNTDKYEGSYCAKGGFSYYQWDLLFTQYPILTTGTHYITFYAKTTTAGDKIRINSASEIALSPTYTGFICEQPLTTSWAFYNISYTQTDSRLLYFNIHGMTDGTGKSLYVDDIKIDGVGAIVAPSSNFTATPLTGDVPLTVQFTDLSSNTPTYHNWSFGDNTYSELQNPTHTYTHSGKYNVSLFVNNSAGSSGKTSAEYITVNKSIPTANFTANRTFGFAPLTIQFTDTSLNEPSGYYWDFGDGEGLVNVQNPTHTYRSNGNYTVWLMASNEKGSNEITKRNYINVGTGSPIYDNGGTEINFSLQTEITTISNYQMPTEFIYARINPNNNPSYDRIVWKVDGRFISDSMTTTGEANIKEARYNSNHWEVYNAGYANPWQDTTSYDALWNQFGFYEGGSHTVEAIIYSNNIVVADLSDTLSVRQISSVCTYNTYLIEYKTNENGVAQAIELDKGTAQFTDKQTSEVSTYSYDYTTHGSNIRAHLTLGHDYSIVATSTGYKTSYYNVTATATTGYLYIPMSSTSAPTYPNGTVIDNSLHAYVHVTDIDTHENLANVVVTLGSVSASTDIYGRCDIIVPTSTLLSYSAYVSGYYGKSGQIQTNADASEPNTPEIELKKISVSVTPNPSKPIYPTYIISVTPNISPTPVNNSTGLNDNQGSIGKVVQYFLDSWSVPRQIQPFLCSLFLIFICAAVGSAITSTKENRYGNPLIIGLGAFLGLIGASYLGMVDIWIIIAIVILALAYIGFKLKPGNNGGEG
jgi:PKD repeat protein